MFGAIAIAIMAAITHGHLDVGLTSASIMVVGLFTLVTGNTWVQSVVQIRALTFLGFISYPLYLMHENMMVALIAKLGKRGVTGLGTPVFPFMVVVSISFIVAKYIEPWIKDRFLSNYSKRINAKAKVGL